MSAVRAVLAIVAGGAFGYAAAALILGLGPRDAGVGIAVAAGLVVIIGLIRYVQRASRRERDKARHPSTRSYPGALSFPGVTYLPYQPQGPVVKERLYSPAIARTVIKGGKRRRWWQ